MSTSNNAFTLQGAAVPKGGGLSFGLSNQTTTPQYATRAAPSPLDAAYGATKGPITGYGTSSAKVGTLPGLIHPTPTAPVKKQTTVDAAGNSTSTEYHAPTPTTPSPTPQAGTTPPTTSPTPQDGTHGRGTGTVTYPGLVGDLANQGNSQFNTSTTGAIGNLNNTAAGNQQYADRAREIASNAGEQISNIGQQGARGEAGYLTTGTSPVGEGNAAVLAQTTAAQQNAVAQGANMELTGNAQGLTAQQQAQSGYNAVAGESLTGQGLAQGALGTAAGLAAPQAYGLTSQPYNPLTDTYGGGGANGALDRAALAGKIGAAQSNAQVGGTAAVDANHAVYNQAVNDLSTTQAAVQNVDQFGKILMDPTQNGGVNPFDPKIANKAWSDIRNQFSSATQAKFNSTLTALQQKIGDLLQAGGSGTAGQLSTDAKQILDGTAKLSTIGQVLDRIGREGNTLLKTLETKKNTAYDGINGGSSSRSSGGWPGWNPK